MSECTFSFLPTCFRKHEREIRACLRSTQRPYLGHWELLCCAKSTDRSWCAVTRAHQVCNLQMPWSGDTQWPEPVGPVAPVFHHMVKSTKHSGRNCLSRSEKWDLIKYRNQVWGLREELYAWGSVLECFFLVHLQPASYSNSLAIVGQPWQWENFKSFSITETVTCPSIIYLFQYCYSFKKMQ